MKPFRSLFGCVSASVATVSFATTILGPSAGAVHERVIHDVTGPQEDGTRSGPCSVLAAHFRQQRSARAPNLGPLKCHRSRGLSGVTSLLLSCGPAPGAFVCPSDGPL